MRRKGRKCGNSVDATARHIDPVPESYPVQKADTAPRHKHATTRGDNVHSVGKQNIAKLILEQNGSISLLKQLLHKLYTDQTAHQPWTT